VRREAARRRDVVNTQDAKQNRGSLIFFRIFKIMIEFKIQAIVLVEPAHFG
jgi:hypothetical protein